MWSGFPVPTRGITPPGSAINHANEICPGVTPYLSATIFNLRYHTLLPLLLPIAEPLIEGMRQRFISGEGAHLQADCSRERSSSFLNRQRLNRLPTVLGLADEIGSVMPPHGYRRRWRGSHLANSCSHRHTESSLPPSGLPVRGRFPPDAAR